LHLKPKRKYPEGNWKFENMPQKRWDNYWTHSLALKTLREWKPHQWNKIKYTSTNNGHKCGFPLKPRETTKKIWMGGWSWKLSLQSNLLLWPSSNRFRPDTGNQLYLQLELVFQVALYLLPILQRIEIKDGSPLKAAPNSVSDGLEIGLVKNLINYKSSGLRNEVAEDSYPIRWATGGLFLWTRTEVITTSLK